MSTFTTHLKEGDIAPGVTSLVTKKVSPTLPELSGKNIILYFYPKDDTPGCTKEACGFRDNYPALVKSNAVIIGVSPDSSARHTRFAEKYGLPFILLPDEDRQIINAYGVWGEKSFMGRRFQGVHRITFWIGTDGKIRRIWSKVKPDIHAKEVLAALLAESGIAS